MAYTYDQLVVSLTQYAEQQPYPFTLVSTDDLYVALPRIIESAEGRIYRSLTMLATRTQDTSKTFTAGNREIDISTISPSIMVVEGIAAITPVGAISAASYRHQFDMATLDMIDAIWPQYSVTRSPLNTPFRYWAMKDHQTIVVAPSMDAAYKCEITGLFMPTAISSTNTTTYLSTVYPELLFASCMIDVAGFLRDYGQQSDDPKLALSWQNQFNELRELAMAEENRRRGAGIGWSANMPTPLAQPPRT
jgi:hypothetical protein